MQQIYRKTPISTCDFKNVSKQLFKFAAYFHLFLRTPLKGCFFIFDQCYTSIPSEKIREPPYSYSQTLLCDEKFIKKVPETFDIGLKITKSETLKIDEYQGLYT